MDALSRSIDTGCGGLSGTPAGRWIQSSGLLSFLSYQSLPLQSSCPSQIAIMQDEEKTVDVQTVAVAETLPLAVVNADDEKMRALGYGAY